MRSRTFATLTVAGSLLLASAGLTASARSPMLSGTVSEERVHALTTEIDWYHNLHKAEDEARKEGKLVFWMHMLGHIDGCT